MPAQKPHGAAQILLTVFDLVPVASDVVILMRLMRMIELMAEVMKLLLKRHEVAPQMRDGRRAFGRLVKMRNGLRKAMGIGRQVGITRVLVQHSVEVTGSVRKLVRQGGRAHSMRRDHGGQRSLQTVVVKNPSAWINAKLTGRNARRISRPASRFSKGLI